MEKLISRRAMVGALAGGLAGVTVAVPVTSTRVIAQSIRITEFSLPDHIDPEESFEVPATIANEGGESASVGVGYYFDDTEIERTETEVSGGEAVDVRLEITPGELREFFGHSIAEGEYSQGFGVFEENVFLDFVEGTVTYGDGASDDASTDAPPGTSTESAERSDRPDDDQARAATTDRPVVTDDGGNDRGFFSNSGEEPGFLSDTFNLTVFGFLLSAFGLVHQMIRGR